MTTALFEAAQQIEGAKSGLKREELAIAPVQSLSPSAVPRESESFAPAAKKQTTDRSRALRLEQNRKAARESRRRKKAMIEELQRSLMFFSKANEHLKQQNELMTRQLLEGHNKLASMGKPVPALDPKAIGIGVEVTKIEEETAPLWWLISMARCSLVLLCRQWRPFNKLLMQLWRLPLATCKRMGLL